MTCQQKFLQFIPCFFASLLEFARINSLDISTGGKILTEREREFNISDVCVNIKSENL